MAKLDCKVYGNANDRENVNIWFCAHPDDKDQFFDKVSKDISDARMNNFFNGKWVIWYDTEPLAEYDEAQFFSDLAEMKLFVIPVTRKFLSTDNRALLVEFKYAVEHGIPVLPLMQEPNLDALFYQKCGSIQYLAPYSRDATAIEYKSKLSDFLSTVFLDDRLRERIFKEFDTTVFLSYRKMDRGYAQHLMHVIHKNEAFRDVSIWYDEFLTPGKDYNHLIDGAIMESKAFVMAMTSSILIAQSYIETHEYPAAVRYGVPIIPVGMDLYEDEVIKDLLNLKFHGIPNRIPIECEEKLHRALFSALEGIELGKKKGNPEHDYLIGLAYLTGTGVEVDKRRAIELITSAAERGHVEAIHKLSTIYSSGNGVARDSEKAAELLLKVIEFYKNKLKHSENLPDEWIEYYLSLYVSNIGAYTWMSALKHKIEPNEAIINDLREIYESLKKPAFKIKVLQTVCGLYDANGFYFFNIGSRETHLRRALESVTELVSLDASRSNLFALSKTLKQLALISYNNMDYEKAEEYCTQAVETSERVMRMSGDVFDLGFFINHHSPEISTGMNYFACVTLCARICIARGDTDKAIEYYKKAVAESEEPTKKSRIVHFAAEVAEANSFIMNYLMSKNDSDGAEEHYRNVLRVLDSLPKNYLFVRSAWTATYIKLGIYRESVSDLSGAETYYLKAWESAEEPLQVMTARNYAFCIRILTLLASLCRRNGAHSLEKNYLGRAAVYCKEYNSRHQTEAIASAIASACSGIFGLPALPDLILTEDEKTPEATAVPSSLFKSAESYIRLGDTHLSVGNAEKAKESYQKAIDLLGELADAYPDEPLYSEALRTTEEKLSAADTPPVDGAKKKKRHPSLVDLFKKKK